MVSWCLIFLGSSGRHIIDKRQRYPNQEAKEQLFPSVLIDGCSQKQWIFSMFSLPFLWADHAWKLEKTLRQRETDAKRWKLEPCTPREDKCRTPAVSAAPCFWDNSSEGFVSHNRGGWTATQSFSPSWKLLILWTNCKSSSSWLSHPAAHS